MRSPDAYATSDNEYFVVLALFGEEFALNLAVPDVSGYSKWLERSGGVSPLFGGSDSTSPDVA